MHNGFFFRTKVTKKDKKKKKIKANGKKGKQPQNINHNTDKVLLNP